MIQLYWTIGRRIVEKQDQYGWGKSIVAQLAEELQKEFVGKTGFSERNLWNMRNYYLAYQAHPKLQTLSAENNWSHKVKILQKLIRSLAQQIHIQATLKNGNGQYVADLIK